ncbi:MAG TPA: YheU family protein [Polyangiales bacterium]
MDEQEAAPETELEIPLDDLSPDALLGVVDDFVLREGTEYGASDFSLQQKVAHVMQQLERSEAQIVFDPNSDSLDIVVVPKGAARL